ncbi:helix-turn-helix transcriptional regulator [Roseibium algicola]|nr:PAS domain-containing protein [Roseibium aggregatum]
MSKLSEHDLVLREAGKIVEALAETFAPMCEVVLHDLTRPSSSIVMIENNISGRSVGDPATELGIARIADPDFPDKLVNYANTLGDGKPVKSTSIGLKDSEGKYIAAICLNLDTSYLNSMASYLKNLTAVSHIDGVSEKLSSPRMESLEDFVTNFAVSKNKDLKALNSGEKRELLSALKERDLLSLKGSVDVVARLLGSSRSSIYYYVK